MLVVQTGCLGPSSSQGCQAVKTCTQTRRQPEAKSSRALQRGTQARSRPAHMRWTEVDGRKQLRACDDDAVISDITLMRSGCRSRAEFMAKARVIDLCLRAVCEVDTLGNSNANREICRFACSLHTDNS